MRNLFEIYNEIYIDKSKWKYYSKMNINPFGSDIDTKKFITRFIELSGKDKENPLYDNIDELDNKRIRHIVSTFFLGTYLYNNIQDIKGPIDIVIKRYQKQNPKSIIEFSFIWYLICLFHDSGYSIENYETYSNFDDFIKDKEKYFSKKPVGVPSLYKNVYKNYFNYRLNHPDNEIRKPDHGICGGIILFNKLNEILDRKQLDKLIRKQNDQASEDNSWSPKLVNIYRYASWVILSHNIFFIRKKDRCEQAYIDHHLDDLILDENMDSKIIYKKHSFLFLLELVDTIEPIKILDNYENLMNLKIEINTNKIILELDDNEHQHEYYEKVYDLKKWLIPNIKVENNRIEIIIQK